MSTVYITAVEMAAGGTRHEHIAYVRWTDEAGKTGWMTREQGVEWLQANDANKARVQSAADPRGYVSVKAIEGKPPYLQTRRNGILMDNLLRLPGGPFGPVVPAGWKRG